MSMTAHQLNQPTPYAIAAHNYRRKGWPGVLPLPAGEKSPVPSGYTGRKGRDPSAADIQTWIEFSPHLGNIALRLPPTVVGVDVDDYNNKGGGQTLTDLEARLGPLPPTIISTSRTDGTSGIRLYRVRERPSWSNPGPGIDIIHHAWRYIVASPSTHPEGGEYRWINQSTGEVLEEPPAPDDFPILPAAWVEHLGSDHTGPEKADADEEEARQWVQQLADGTPDRLAQQRLHEYEQALDNPDMARHDAILAPVITMLRAGESGAHGIPTVLHQARQQFIALVTTPGEGQRTQHQAESEWKRAVVGAYQIIKADPGAPPVGAIDGTALDRMLTSNNGPESPQAVAEPAAQPHTPPQTSSELPATRLEDGALFILDTDSRIQPIWGTDGQVAWADGEPLMITGPTGVGKTTIAHQLLERLLGTNTDQLLGMDVPVTAGKVLYIAADRPPQIRRAFARRFGEQHRQTLADKLIVHNGYLPQMVDKNPTVLLQLVQQTGADVLVIDSLKDVSTELEPGPAAVAINQALQAVCQAGCNVLVLHHQRKSQGDNKRPKTIDDIYGNTLIPSGAGSVLLVWGKPGDMAVELHHLKQPSEDIGPLDVTHDHISGQTRLDTEDVVDLLAIVRHKGSITLHDAAFALFGTTPGKGTEGRNEREKARRELNKLGDKGLLKTREGHRDGGGKPPKIWVPTDTPDTMEQTFERDSRDWLRD